MGSCIFHSLHLLLAIFVLLTFTTSFVRSSHEQLNKAILTDDIDYQAANRSKVLAIFVFGDSTVDPGNNNFIVTAFKSNFPPYGHEFPGGQPTGRFTNGRLVTDFIEVNIFSDAASYVGVKEYIPPYLDPTLTIQDLKTGVSFASAGSGLDPLTAKIDSVISISKQMEYFREYRSKMERAIGKPQVDHIIDHSIFVISVGTNDFGVNYFLLPVRRKKYTVSEYEQFLMEQLQQLIQELVKEEVKKIGVVGLPPLGCLPFLITLFSKDRFSGRECIKSFSSIGRDYNEMLKNELKSKTYQTEGLKIVYADIFTPLNLIFQNPKEFGFEEVQKGCCGTGVAETAILCNPTSTLCPDIPKYAFFDSIHPTEKTYRILFESIKPTIDYVLAS